MVDYFWKCVLYNLRDVCIPTSSIRKISDFFAFVIWVVPRKMLLRFLLSKINGPSLRLQVRMISHKVATIIISNIRIPTCTIYSVHTDVGHYFVSVTSNKVSLSATKLIAPSYL